MQERTQRFLFGFFALLIVCFSQSAFGQWTRFRGPNGSGISDSKGLPLEFGPEKNVLWKTKVPFARSSPVIAGKRLFLTATEGNDLIVLCLDAGDGRILWRRNIARPRAAAIYRLNDPASPTPVTDGRNVYAFFADLGLVSYTADGKERWRVPLGPFNSFYGMANSPVLVGNAVVQLCDARTDPFMVAVNSKNGKILWRVKRPTKMEGFSTPIVRASKGSEPEILVLGNRRLNAYSPKDGKALWGVEGFGYFVVGGPVLDGKGTVFINAEGEDSPSLPPFAEILKMFDANGDRKLEREELKSNAEFYDQFGVLDTNMDKYADENEYNFVRMETVGGQGFAAVSLKGIGQATEGRILWRHPKSYSSTSTPILYQGILYAVKKGGVIIALDAATGKVLKEDRSREAMEDYFSSPVAADGMIYTVSEAGKVSVIKPGADWQVLRVNDLGDECYATPAIDSGRIYMRTRNSLFCFGNRKE